MDTDLLSQLLEETISLAEEDEAIESVQQFTAYICDMLPMEVLQQLEDINGSNAFLEDIWYERYEDMILAKQAKALAKQEQAAKEDILEDGLCLICERKVRLTRHHVFPRETHKTLVKKGYDPMQINTTIAICRMCHSTVHRFFTNDELADSYYSVELLLEDDRMMKYAKWASAQSDKRYNKS